MSKIVDETITVADLINYVRKLQDKETDYIKAIESLRGGSLDGAAKDLRPPVKTLYTILKHIQFELKRVGDLSMEEIQHDLLVTLKEEKDGVEHETTYNV